MKKKMKDYTMNVYTNYECMQMLKKRQIFFISLFYLLFLPYYLFFGFYDCLNRLKVREKQRKFVRYG